MSKYHSNWKSREDVINDFFDRDYNFKTREYTERAVPEGFPTEEEILYAGYETPSYEGYALVIYERDGKLYEVTGSHCSCYGLEGQWTPEETTWPALALRKDDAYDLPDPAAYRALVNSRLQEAA